MDTLAETAEQARNLLEHVKTGTNIRDIMELLARKRDYGSVRPGFFMATTSRNFIGDYGS